MELYGSNAPYGKERTNLTEDRYVLPIVEDDKIFPFGLGGLLPVVTPRRKGGERTDYAFWYDGDYVEWADVRDPQDATDMAMAVLVDAVGLVNRMLEQAEELSRHRFGHIYGVQLGIPEWGRSFTRVEVIPLDPDGLPNPNPIRLTIETGDKLGAPESLEACIDYDRNGEPHHVAMTEYDFDGYQCKVSVTMNENKGKLSVQKVEEYLGDNDHVNLLYRRGAQQYRRGGRW